MLSIIATLCRWLDQPEQRRLRREFALWVQRVLLRRKPFAERSILQGEEIQDLEEVQQMLAERMNEWEKEWEQRGLKKGELRGESKSLLLLLEQRFGKEAAERYRPRIEQADEPSIQQWLIRVLTAERIEEIFRED